VDRARLELRELRQETCGRGPAGRNGVNAINNLVVQLIDLVDVTVGREGKFVIYLGAGPFLTLRTTEVVAELYREVEDDADRATAPTAA